MRRILFTFMMCCLLCFTAAPFLTGCTTTCETCEGHGVILCPDCKGEGEVECPYCEGKKNGKERCKDCEGTGEFKVTYDKPIECPQCLGDGDHATLVDGVVQHDTCDKCDGEGKITVDFVECESCKGFGYLDKTCSTCYGDGYVDCEKCDTKGKLTCPDCGGKGEID